MRVIYLINVSCLMCVCSTFMVENTEGVTVHWMFLVTLINNVVFFGRSQIRNKGFWPYSGCTFPFLTSVCVFVYVCV